MIVEDVEKILIPRIKSGAGTREAALFTVIIVLVNPTGKSR